MVTIIVRCDMTPSIDFNQEGLLDQPETMQSHAEEIISLVRRFAEEDSIKLKGMLEEVIRSATDLRACARDIGARELANFVGELDKLRKEPAVCTEEDMYVEIHNALRIWRKGISDEDIDRIIAAMRENKREEFVMPEYKQDAYQDTTLPLSEGQTISQPSLVAHMIYLLDLKQGDRVLDIGTGSGWQTAILGSLLPDSRIYSIECLPSLAEMGRANLAKVGRTNVSVIEGDGTSREVLAQIGTVDKIIVAATASEVPQALVDMLAENGKIVIPVGQPAEAKLMSGVKRDGKLNWADNGRCRFVPLIGEYNRHSAEPEPAAGPESAPPPATSPAEEEITERAKGILRRRLGENSETYKRLISQMDRLHVTVVNRPVTKDDMGQAASRVSKRIMEGGLVAGLEFHKNDAGFPVGIEAVKIYCKGELADEHYKHLVHELVEYEIIEDLLRANQNNNCISCKDLQDLANFRYTDWLTRLLTVKRRGYYRLNRQEIIDIAVRAFINGLSIIREKKQNDIARILFKTQFLRKFIVYADLFNEAVLNEVEEQLLRLREAARRYGTPIDMAQAEEGLKVRTVISFVSTRVVSGEKRKWLLMDSIDDSSKSATSPAQETPTLLFVSKTRISPVKRAALKEKIEGVSVDVIVAKNLPYDSEEATAYAGRLLGKRPGRAVIIDGAIDIDTILKGIAPIAVPMGARIRTQEEITIDSLPKLLSEAILAIPAYRRTTPEGLTQAVRQAGFDKEALYSFIIAITEPIAPKQAPEWTKLQEAAISVASDVVACRYPERFLKYAQDNNLKESKDKNFIILTDTSRSKQERIANLKEALGEEFYTLYYEKNILTLEELGIKNANEAVAKTTEYVQNMLEDKGKTLTIAYVGGTRYYEEAVNIGLIISGVLRGDEAAIREALRLLGDKARNINPENLRSRGTDLRSLAESIREEERAIKATEQAL